MFYNRLFGTLMTSPASMIVLMRSFVELERQVLSYVSTNFFVIGTSTRERYGDEYLLTFIIMDSLMFKNHNSER